MPTPPVPPVFAGVVPVYVFPGGDAFTPVSYGSVVIYPGGVEIYPTGDATTNWLFYPRYTPRVLNSQIRPVTITPSGDAYTEGSDAPHNYRPDYAAHTMVCIDLFRNDTLPFTTISLKAIDAHVNEHDEAFVFMPRNGGNKRTDVGWHMLTDIVWGHNLWFIDADQIGQYGGNAYCYGWEITTAPFWWQATPEMPDYVQGGLGQIGKISYSPYIRFSDQPSILTTSGFGAFGFGPQSTQDWTAASNVQYDHTILSVPVYESDTPMTAAEWDLEDYRSWIVFYAHETYYKYIARDNKYSYVVPDPPGVPKYTGNIDYTKAEEWGLDYGVAMFIWNQSTSRFESPVGRNLPNELARLVYDNSVVQCWEQSKKSAKHQGIDPGDYWSYYHMIEWNHDANPNILYHGLAGDIYTFVKDGSVHILGGVFPDVDQLTYPYPKLIGNIRNRSNALGSYDKIDMQMGYDTEVTLSAASTQYFYIGFEATEEQHGIWWNFIDTSGPWDTRVHIRNSAVLPWTVYTMDIGTLWYPHAHKHACLGGLTLPAVGVSAADYPLDLAGPAGMWLLTKFSFGIGELPSIVKRTDDLTSEVTDYGWSGGGYATYTGPSWADIPNEVITPFQHTPVHDRLNVFYYKLSYPDFELQARDLVQHRGTWQDGNLRQVNSISASREIIVPRGAELAQLANGDVILVGGYMSSRRTYFTEMEQEIPVWDGTQQDITIKLEFFMNSGTMFQNNSWLDNTSSWLMSVDSDLLGHSKLYVKSPGPSVINTIYDINDDVVVADPTDFPEMREASATPITTDILEVRASLEVGRFGHTVTPIGGDKFLVVGGYASMPRNFWDVINGKPLKTIEIFDANTNISSVVGHMAGRRAYHTVTQIAPKLYVAIGGDTIHRYRGNSFSMQDAYTIDHPAPQPSYEILRVNDNGTVTSYGLKRLPIPDSRSEPAYTIRGHASIFDPNRKCVWVIGGWAAIDINIYQRAANIADPARIILHDLGYPIAWGSNTVEVLPDQPAGGGTWDRSVHPLLTHEEYTPWNAGPEVSPFWFSAYSTTPNPGDIGYPSFGYDVPHLFERLMTEERTIEPCLFPGPRAWRYRGFVYPRDGDGSSQFYYQTPRAPYIYRVNVRGSI